jgi:phosphohistidine phosphatase
MPFPVKGIAILIILIIQYKEKDVWYILISVQGTIMKKIYVMRHAKAVHNSKIDDHERPLHAQGIEECRRMAELLERGNIIPQRILCSTSERTRATAELLAYHAVPINFLPSLYLATSDELLQEIRKLDDKVSSVMLIGHNPGLHNLCLTLADRGDYDAYLRLRDGFPTAGVAVLGFEESKWKAIAARSGVLEALYSA